MQTYDTNQELIQIMAARGLSYRDVAGLVGKSIHTVNAWLRTPENRGYRNMHPNDLRILKIELAQRQMEKTK